MSYDLLAWKQQIPRGEYESHPISQLWSFLILEYHSSHGAPLYLKDVTLISTTLLVSSEVN